MKTEATAARSADPLAGVGQSQKERLAHIEFRLYFLGNVRRQDLMNRFGIAPAVATRDFSLYRDLFPDNIQFDGRTKSYVTGKIFSPAFTYSGERVLTALSRGFGDGLNSTEGPLVRCELPMSFIRPSLEVLAPVTRAIHQRKVVQIHYYSHSSGLSSREIVPFALVNDGLRWHARAFDRKSREFRDFVFTRMETARLVEESSIGEPETADKDDQWNRIVDLELVPHPAQERPQIIERDYGMSGGVLRARVRAANAGYVLRQWIVDCSADHSLEGPEYRLWLRDPLVLYGVESAKIAPGYRAPKIAVPPR